MQIARVSITLTLVAVTDLHDELAVLSELEQLVIGNRLEPGQTIGGAIISANPYEALVVDMDAVLALRPFVAITRSTPSFDVVACRVEHDHRWRSIGRLLRLECPRTVQDPDVILRINRNTRGVSQLPFGRHLRPRTIHFEDG